MIFLAQNCTGLCAFASVILNLINNVLVPVIFAIAFLVFIWGAYKYFILGAADGTAQKEGRDLVLWGIIGFVVMISIWGMVNVVARTFNLDGVFAPPLPTSVSPYQ